MRFDGFIGPWNATNGFAADSQRAINLYPEPTQSEAAKVDNVLRGSPGLVTFSTLATTPVRGILSAGAPLTGSPRCFAVGGSKLYEINSGGVATLLGDVGNDAGNTPVDMFLNGTQLLIVSAGQSYVDNGAGPTSAGMPTARTGAYIDGYGIVQRPASRQFDISALNDFTTWDALDFEIKGGYPDHIGSIIASHQHLWLLGESTTEVWRHTGNPDFPFEREFSVHQGNAAPFARTRLMNGVAWLGQDNRGKVCAWWAQGGTPRRVSTYAIEDQLDVGTISDAIGWTQVTNGHHFWWLQFPTLNQTWVFDATTGWWHQRAWWDGAAITKHRARCHAFCFNKHLVGDHTSGKIYEMSDAYGTDDGTAIHRIRMAPHVGTEEHRLFYSEFMLDMVSDTSVNPTVYLMYSDNNGNTWTAEKSRSGTAGFKHRRQWRRLGKSRDRIWSVRTDVAANVTFLDAFLKLEKGSD